MPLILFINPVNGPSPARGDLLKSYLSLGTLAAALRDTPFMGRMAALLDEPVGPPVPEFEVKIVHLEPDLTQPAVATRLSASVGGSGPPLMVGITATATRLQWARTAAGAARRLWPQALLVAGGPHCSVEPASLAAPGLCQAACRGEGVETVSELALRLGATGQCDLSKIRGLSWIDPLGAIHHNRARRPVMRLDDYPPASRSLDLFLPEGRVAVKDAGELVFMLVGHGCPYDCHFCAQRAIHAGRIRERSAQSIFSEIEDLYKLGYRNFALVQETFLNRKERVDRFLSLIESSRLDIQWTVEARCDQLTGALLERMKAAGLRMIQIGLESGDPRLLDRIGKRLELEEAAALILAANALEIDTAVYLLVGLPGQDWQSILRTARFLRENRPYNRTTGHVSVAVALPYPGTRMAAAGSVRMIEPVEGAVWPQRSPGVSVDADGAFEVEPISETDVMMAREVSESFFFLDDFSQFLINSRNAGLLDAQALDKAEKYALRMLGMIVQRVIREHVVRAQAPETDRRAALQGLIRRHGQESRLAVMSDPALGLDDEGLMDFLLGVRFEGGHAAMKVLTWEQRLKLMTLCAREWTASGRTFTRVVVEPDDEAAGSHLAQVLEGLSLARKFKDRPYRDAIFCQIEKQFRLMTLHLTIRR